MRVLELGWEFPPRISGGLGTACEGIVRGLIAQDVEVLLVLPRLAGGEERSGATVLSAAALEAARTAATLAREASAYGDATEGGLEVIGLPSALRPYLDAAAYASGVGDAVAHAPMTGGYGKNLFDEVARYARVVSELAAREQFDVIHAHDWMTYSAGVAARAASGKPLVCHVHASEWDRCGEAGDPRVIALEQHGFDVADRVVCVSHFTRRVLERHYDIDPAKVRVVHNAVRRDPTRHHPAEGAPPLFQRGANHPPTVLFLGRLTRQKGPAFFLEAASLIHAARPDVRFLVAGDGDLKASLVEASAASGLARQVFFTGFLEPHEVERAYAAADLYVMPSVSEPFGIAPLEALSFDVPVIVSRQSGVAETLPSAPKVDYWDVPDLALKVLSLLERPELRRALVESGQRDIEALRWETNGERLCAVFRELLQGPARGAASRGAELRAAAQARSAPLVPDTRFPVGSNRPVEGAR
ncbi:MAG: glycosyltransferase [Planctomycetota bacterium]